MKDLKFRCHNLGRLMTVLKTPEKLPAGAKTLIEEMWEENELGYKERVYVDAMKKGHLCEAASRDLVQEVLGGPFRKRNTKLFENDFLRGTPDNLEPLEDIKNAQTVRTFRNAELKNEYEWQIRAYMMLLNDNGIECNEGSVIYTLNPDPEEMILEQEKRLYFRYDCDDTNQDYIDQCAQIRHNNELILKLDPAKRVKVFRVVRDQELEELIKVRVRVAREYYDTITF